ncbi:MAG: D-alanine--D-alanine ligase [bacterium]|nr:D-alanine--D-alanine ligase [bacterium]
MSKRKLKVALIFGGTSKEREVSLHTGLTVAGYLNPKKYDVIPVEISKSGRWLISSETIGKIGRRIKTHKVSSTSELVPVSQSAHGKIDIAFLALHGPGGEDGTIQGMLELLNIPYTCSGVLASALAMDKARTKRLVMVAGVPAPPDVLIYRKHFSPRILSPLLHGMKRGGYSKVVIKPNKMGSSLGISIASGRNAIARGIKEALKHDNEILIEPYIQGREITVPVLGNDNPVSLPVIEIVPWEKSTFYDYRAKYETGGSRHIIPAKLTKQEEREVKKLALLAHQTLGCRGVTRSDFILSPEGRFYFLEINTIPGMTPVSLVPQSAAAAGMSFSKLLDELIKLAKQ